MQNQKQSIIINRNGAVYNSTILTENNTQNSVCVRGN